MAKKELVITLVKTELVYEVQNKTHLTGISRDNGNNFEQVANMQMGDDEEHKNQILRSLGDAYRELKTKMSNYLVGNTDKSNDIQEVEDGDFKLILKMPYRVITPYGISNQKFIFIAFDGSSVFGCMFRFK